MNTAPHNIVPLIILDVTPSAIHVLFKNPTVSLVTLLPFCHPGSVTKCHNSLNHSVYSVNNMFT